MDILTGLCIVALIVWVVNLSGGNSCYRSGGCDHKWRTINQGQYQDFNQLTGQTCTGNYYDQECEHCGEIRQIRR